MEQVGCFTWQSACFAICCRTDWFVAVKRPVCALVAVIVRLLQFKKHKDYKLQHDISSCNFIIYY